MNTELSSEQVTVLRKATRAAGAQLGLSDEEICNVLRVSNKDDSTLVHLKTGSQIYHNALRLIQASRHLDALFGGDPKWISHFMRTMNAGTGGIPAEQVRTSDGLELVLRYLEKIRSKSL